jgi:hypothetical protein
MDVKGAFDHVNHRRLLTTMVAKKLDGDLIEWTEDFLTDRTVQITVDGISQHFTVAKDSETDKGKETITPPAPKKSFLDRASNRLARTVAQIPTGHWRCAPYLKRVRKNREEQVSDICWWCGQYRMSRTHVFLRCMHPKLEGARNDFWDRPDEDGKIRKRPTSVGQLLGKLKWEQPLADGITATGVGLVGQDRVEKEDERVERNDGWRREPFL